MTFIVGEPCIDVLDKPCVDVSPMDCICTVPLENYVNADDCSACANVCRVAAIFPQSRAIPNTHKPYLADSVQFFSATSPGREVPIGTIGGSAKIGVVGTITLWWPLRREWHLSGE
jgi:MinD superfamily P-loop ATPase